MQAFKSALICLLISGISISTFARSETDVYIEKFRDLAISEMIRTGIPASIKMGQAILESSSGTSELATQANNHFGIKCGNNWSGSSYDKYDDDYQNGLLVHSCFRVYKDPANSFLDHSDFLSNPNSSRYNFLFTIDIVNYRAWAYGLKQAGYATDPKYPEKLIEIIEKYKLYTLDEMGDPARLADGGKKFRNQAFEAEVSNERKEFKGDIVIQTKMIPQNTSNYIYKNGDRMEEIARRFNMDLRELYIRNRIPFDKEPIPGEKLHIKDYIQFGKPVQAKAKQSKDSFLFEETLVIPAAE